MRASLATRSRLVGHGAEACVEDHALKLRQSVDQLYASLVLLPEEAGIGEAGAQHPLVAGDDGVSAVPQSRYWRP